MASVIIQSYLTFTSLRVGQVPTITFTDGGTAGFEVVTVTGYSNITVQIQDGVTTMLQIQQAIQNHTTTSGFTASQLVSVSITSGHNSDVVHTLVNAVLTGGVSAVLVPGGYLGRASSFSVLGDTAVTNTGNTTLSGDLGISPGSSITGFPPGTYAGALHQTDTVAANAHTDATSAAATLSALTPFTDISSTDLGGYTAVAGNYHATSTGTWSAGPLTLNAAGNPNAVFVFVFGTGLTMPASATVVLENGAQANNVYFVTGTTFTFGANCTVNGNILAGTSITFAASSILNGRALTYGPSGTTVTFPSAGTVTTTPYASPSPSTFASKIIGPIQYISVAEGTAGNAISIAYTDGATAGSEIVSVIGNAISVQIADCEGPLAAFIEGPGSEHTIQTFPVSGVDYSNSGQIIAVIRASVAASALVVADYWIVGSTSPIYADSAQVPVFLLGGLNGAPATVTEQGLTVTSITDNASQNGKTLSLTTGATAGAEVVTLDSSNNISVQIQNGVSTVTQVRTALNSYAPFVALYEASGTSSTLMYTVNQAVLS